MFQLEKHISLYLQANGIGTIAGATGWGIFRSQLPTAPITCVVVTENGGKPIMTMGGVVGNFFNFNILVRGNAGSAGFDAAKSKADDIYELLKFVPSLTEETVVYRNIRVTTNVINGGQDKAGCPMFSINFAGLY